MIRRYIVISYRSFPWPETRRGRGKNKVIFERKHAKSIAGPGFAYVPETLRLELRGKVTTTRGNTGDAGAGKNWKSGNSPGEIAKSKWALWKLSQTSLSWPLRFYRVESNGRETVDDGQR